MRRRQGEILWQTRVGEGGMNGGVQWGMATDGEYVYATTSDVGRTRWTGNPFDTRRYVLDPQRGGGLTALRVADGSRVWHAPAAPCPDGAPAGCSPAQPGAVTLIPGAVFATSNDGHVRAHATADGRVLWDFDTVARVRHRQRRAGARRLARRPRRRRRGRPRARRAPAIRATAACRATCCSRFARTERPFSAGC